MENEGADPIAALGYRIHQNPTKQEIAAARLRIGGGGNSEKSPDYLIEGHVFDCYAPAPWTSTSTCARTCWPRRAGPT
ncbi:hypothetical protein GA0070606_3461 [Micromonospora citrea]|uniref:Uncharacterized protein n=1 Tax=Micromonospora citrea TaxID=47855 RepID=A0A1C6V5A7_9ACTN|nr:hypothetical protein GA0070606_3461 [Micromonospora citrea]